MLNKGRETRHSHAASAAGHRADIDGLRAVAILGVLAYHFGLGVPGGYGGVDVFFVISGFLIAGIIRRELEAGTFSLANFYVRRIRRILPALAVCLLVTTIAAVVILFPMDLKRYGRSLLSATLSASNFHFAGRTGYFDGAALEKPLLHTWSLAVEEQFYIVFPLGLLLLFRHARKSILLVLSLVVALSLAYSVFSVDRSPDTAFFSTLARAWELGVGVLVAFGAAPVLARRWMRELAALAGAVLIGGCLFLYDDRTLFPGLAAVPICLGTALIISSGSDRQTSFVAKCLSLRPMAGVGLISYSVYLWHWPVLVLATYRFPEIFGDGAEHAALARAGLAIASFAIGALSWRFVEEPFRRGKAPSTKVVFRGGAAGILALSALAGVVIVGGKWLHRWPAAIYAMTFTRTTPGRALGLERMPGWPLNTYLIGAHGTTPDTVLWGDSFAQAIIPGFIDYHEKAGQGIVIAADPGCPPLLGVTFYRRSKGDRCKPHNDAVFESIKSASIRRVVIIARWASFARTLVRDGDGKPIVSGRHGNADGTQFAIVLEAMVRRLVALNKEVILLGPIPSQLFEVSPAIARHIAWGAALPPKLTVAQFSYRERLVLPVLSRLETVPHVQVVYPHQFLCDANSCRYSSDGKPLYSDDGHLSREGVANISAMFADIFEDTRQQQAADIRTLR